MQITLYVRSEFKIVLENRTTRAAKKIDLFLDVQFRHDFYPCRFSPCSGVVFIGIFPNI